MTAGGVDRHPGHVTPRWRSSLAIWPAGLLQCMFVLMTPSTTRCEQAAHGADRRLFPLPADILDSVSQPASVGRSRFDLTIQNFLGQRHRQPGVLRELGDIGRFKKKRGNTEWKDSLHRRRTLLYSLGHHGKS